MMNTTTKTVVLMMVLLAGHREAFGQNYSQPQELSTGKQVEGSPLGSSSPYPTAESDVEKAQPAATSTPPKNPYEQLFYQNDFSYLSQENAVPVDVFDRLKRIPLHPNTTLEVGGENRLRYHHQQNQRRNGTSNDYLLHRTRLYGHLRFDDLVRAYA